MNIENSVINGVSKGLGLSLDFIKNDIDDDKILITEVTNDNNSHHFDMKNKIQIYNYKQQIISLNHSQEKIYEFNRYMNLKENKNNKYNSFVKDKLSPRMYKNQNQKMLKI